MSALVIACPNCGTRYSTDAAGIGPKGRTVRCARCSETWFVPAPEPVPTLDDSLDAKVLEDLKAETAPVSTPAPQAPLTTASDAMERVPETVPPVAAPTVTVGADVMMRDQADRQKLARRRRTLMIIWIVPLILVLIAALYAVLNRQEIVNRYPQSATLYNAVGLDVKLGGLDIEPPVATTTLIAGQPVVRVEGRVRNLTGKTRPVPMIELTLEDEAGQALAQWYVEPTQPTLPGRGSLTFQTEYSDPPEGVRNMTYRFAPES